jgi:hypothetical protein
MILLVQNRAQEGGVLKFDWKGKIKEMVPLCGYPFVCTSKEVAPLGIWRCHFGAT